MTSCSWVDRWLDEDRPAAGQAAAEAHAAGCARCARALGADDGLRAALRTPPVARAPAGLADGVMARVRALPATEGPNTGEGEGAGPVPVRGPGWIPIVAPWAAAGVGLGAAVWLLGEPLARAASSLGRAVSGPEGVAPDLAALEGATQALAQRLAETPTATLTAGSLAFAAVATALAWLLARASEAAFGPRAYR